MAERQDNQVLGASPGSHLLLVSESPEIRDAVTTAATEIGLRTRTAGNVETVRRIWRQSPPGIVVLDLAIRGTDPLELLRFLVAQGTSSRVLLLGSSDSEIAAAIRRVGATGERDAVGFLWEHLRYDQLRAGLAPVIRALAAESVSPDREPIDGADLRRAVDAGEITAYFQPKLEIPAAGHPLLAGFEALARWPHPERGMVPPSVFIPLAEQTGVIGPLTDQVLRIALGQTRAWESAGLTLDVSVNMSPEVLSQPALAERLSAMVSMHGLDASRLVLEVSVQAMRETTVAMSDNLAGLRARGYGLSLDDFSGVDPHVQELRGMPFTEIKVDRSLTARMDLNTDAWVLVRSIVHLGHGLGLSVCAEGVESDSTLEMLADYGCDSVQGYLFAEARPAGLALEGVATGGAAP